MEAAATKWLDRLKKLAPAAWAGRAWPPTTWRARAPPPTVAVKPAQPPEIKPKLLNYDAQGNLLTLQEEQTKISTYEILNWRTWYEAPQLRESLDEEMAKSLLLVAVQRLFLDMPAPKGVDLVRRKGAVSCVATMEFEAGALEIAPVVTGKQFIVGKTTHPCAVHVQVPIGADKIVPLYIVPELKLPTPPSLTADVLVRDGEAALTDHEWARNHTACLFWTVQRGPKPAAATRGHGDSAPRRWNGQLFLQRGGGCPPGGNSSDRIRSATDAAHPHRYEHADHRTWRCPYPAADTAKAEAAPT